MSQGWWLGLAPMLESLFYEARRGWLLVPSRVGRTAWAPGTWVEHAPMSPGRSLALERTPLEGALGGRASDETPHKSTSQVTLSTDFVFNKNSREATASFGYDYILRQARLRGRIDTGEQGWLAVEGGRRGRGQGKGGARGRWAG